MAFGTRDAFFLQSLQGKHSQKKSEPVPNAIPHALAITHWNYALHYALYYALYYALVSHYMYICIRTGVRA